MRFAFVVVCLGSLLGPLDGSVNVAFPAITKAFALQLGDIQWIVVSYILVQSAIALAAGKLGDVLGHRRVFLAGTALAVVAFTANAFAPTYAWLVATRALQGVAIGMTLATGPALVTLMYPAARKREILAAFVAFTSIGSAFGPLAAGALVDVAGWESVFWFRIPVAITVLALSFTIPEVNARGRLADLRFDFAGTALLTGALAGLVFAVTAARHPAGSATLVSVLLAVSLLLAVTFVWHERRCPTPILPIQTFRDSAFAMMQFAAVVIHCASFSVFLLMPYALAAHDGVAAPEIGVLLAMFSAGLIAGGLSDRYVTRTMSANAILIVGLALTGAGLVLLGPASAAGSRATIGVAHFLVGGGLGLFSVGHMDATTSRLPAADRGVASSLVAVMRLVGLVSGAAGLTWLHAMVGGPGAGHAGFRSTFMCAGAATLAAAVLVWFAGRKSRSSPKLN